MPVAPALGRDGELALLGRVGRPDGPAGVAITGAAGVGKTHLLRAAVAAAAERGLAVEHLVGGPAIRAIPFGAASHLLPAELGTDLTTLLNAVRRALRRRAGGRTLLLAVDDAHELDDMSAALVRQFVVREEANLLMTTRSGAAVPEPLALLGRDNILERLTLGPLPRAAAEQLAATVLGDSVTTDLADALWELTRGHPLYVVVGLRAAQEEDRLVHDDGQWGLGSTLVTARLEELVNQQLERLPPQARSALATIAVAEPVPRRHLAGIAAPADLDLLTQRQLVACHVGADGEVLTTSHPVYAEVVGAALPREARAEILGRLVDAVAADARADDADRLRAAVWMLDADRPIDPALALAGARQALHRLEYPLAQQLATAASDAGAPATETALTLARALAFQGRGDDALHALEGVGAADPSDTAALAMERGHVLAFVLGRPAAAVDELARAEAGLPAQWQGVLQAQRSLYAAIAGDFTAARDAAAQTLANPESPGPARTTAYVNVTLADAMTGRLAGIDATARDGRELARAHSAELPLALTQIDINLATAHTAAGRLADLDARLHSAVDPAEGRPPDPMSLVWLGIVLGMRGLLGEAAAAVDRALEVYTLGDPFRLRPQGVGIGVMLRAQAGGVGPADEELLHQAAAQAGDETRLAVWIERGRAWLTAGTDPAAGAALAVAAGVRAVERDHVTWGIWALHDAVRMGFADAAAAALGEAVAATTGAPMLAAMLDHAAALVARNPEQLTAVAARLAGFGSPLFAAEALAQAARLSADEPARHRAAVRAQLRLRDCVGAATPEVRALAGGLTGRELEIAQLAPRHTSRDIAERMFLSARTVDNHLRGVYVKLGVGSRAELAELLDSPAELE